ncbi:DNA repair protein RadC [Melioribacter roseus P3M-2]|uniref:DNA repair protein RadC n=1 Tax=Melioribacter roseus (strain DSM 23840 / JCM 17771 / VKM B-2668 / P3M-2) TaxID=1191523 RepID=I6ZU37_MELRP|nr:DNA repair protein RadC [Melioribacter roseus]AFN75524.1 DNA repair protein RadC [Melioribacter roseus P3M-2]
MAILKELPPDDRPREKLITKGVQSLSDAELLAILLRTGTKGTNVIEIARNLLKNFKDLSVLSIQTFDSLKNQRGIGKDKAATLLAAFELGRRIDANRRWRSDKKIVSPSDIAEYMIPMLRDEVKEKFYVVCLSSSNKIIKEYNLISEGSLNSSVVQPREVFKVAIESNSASVILVHNHPSGNLEPSREDIQLTKRMIEAGKLLNIKVLDHLIIAGNNYTSLVEKRLV